MGFQYKQICPLGGGCSTGWMRLVWIFRWGEKITIEAGRCIVDGIRRMDGMEGSPDGMKDRAPYNAKKKSDRYCKYCSFSGKGEKCGLLLYFVA